MRIIFTLLIVTVVALVIVSFVSPGVIPGGFGFEIHDAIIEGISKIAPGIGGKISALGLEEGAGLEEGEEGKEGEEAPPPAPGEGVGAKEILHSLAQDAPEVNADVQTIWAQPVFRWGLLALAALVGYFFRIHNKIYNGLVGGTVKNPTKILNWLAVIGIALIAIYIYSTGGISEAVSAVTPPLAIAMLMALRDRSSGWFIEKLGLLGRLISELISFLIGPLFWGASLTLSYLFGGSLSAFVNPVQAQTVAETGAIKTFFNIVTKVLQFVSIPVQICGTYRTLAPSAALISMLLFVIWIARKVFGGGMGDGGYVHEMAVEVAETGGGGRRFPKFRS